MRGSTSELSRRLLLVGRPLWVRAISVYLVIHLVLLPAFVVAWQRQGPNRSSYPDGPPDFLTFLALSWDGSWYHEIALHGYPSALELDPTTGLVRQSAWAFFPLFPMLVGGLTRVTGLPFVIVSPALSFITGAAASALLAVLVRDSSAAACRVRPGLPLLAVAALAAFPSGATALVGYSESLAILLIVASLLLVFRRSYLLATLPIILLGFTRAVALPMVIVVGWHAYQQWRDARVGGTTLGLGDRVRLGVLAGTAVASGFAWPVVTAIALGDPRSYFVVQSAWRQGSSSSMPFSQFGAKLSEWIGPLGFPVVLATCVALIALGLSRWTRPLGAELQSWGTAYLVYIVAVADLGSTVLRFALLSLTLPIALVAWPPRRIVQVLMVAILMAMQILWILRIWVFDGVGDAFPP